jgi:threonine dehydrogenase-like Zn-dependent dehydrogenase
MTPTETGIQRGHEFIGIVEAIGKDVRTVKKGDYVIAPFAFSDGTCAFCHDGIHTSCTHGGFFGIGMQNVGGGQSEAVRVPLADGTLVPFSSSGGSDVLASILTLTDVMGTGHHAAVSARVSPGKRVVVVGDGAVGLSGVIAAKRLGAEQIIMMGRHPGRITLAREFGATDVVRERGEEGIERVKSLTGGFGAHSVLECVGSEEAIATSLGIVRPGGAVGRVGVPHYATIPSAESVFYANVTVSGGPAPVRAYIHELLPDVLEGRIMPGRVFDKVVGLDGVPEGYKAMNERTVIKVMVEL